ncbi:TPA: putative immunity/bacteriocin fusion bifunctional protein [Staphylococcus pseudintermedius]
MRKEKQNEPEAVGVRWNGKAYTCSMGRFYACAHYCGM